MTKTLFHIFTIAFTAWFAHARDAVADEWSVASPDGVFKVVRHSPKEVEAGKPVFIVVESASGKTVWSAQEGEFWGSGRSEHKILWSPDSKRFALSCGINVRSSEFHVFGWDGATFVKQWNAAEKLEGLARAKAETAMKEEGKKGGYSKQARLGMSISFESMPERWVNASSVIITYTEKWTVTDDKDGAEDTSGTTRVLLRWDTRKKTFLIARELKPDEQPK